MIGFMTSNLKKHNATVQNAIFRFKQVYTYDVNAINKIYNTFPNTNYCNGVSSIMLRENVNSNYSYQHKQMMNRQNSQQGGIYEFRINKINNMMSHNQQQVKNYAFIFILNQHKLVEGVIQYSELNDNFTQNEDQSFIMKIPQNLSNFTIVIEVIA